MKKQKLKSSGLIDVLYAHKDFKQDSFWRLPDDPVLLPTLSLSNKEMSSLSRHDLSPNSNKSSKDIRSQMLSGLQLQSQQLNSSSRNNNTNSSNHNTTTTSSNSNSNNHHIPTITTSNAPNMMMSAPNSNANLSSNSNLNHAGSPTVLTQASVQKQQASVQSSPKLIPLRGTELSDTDNDLFSLLGKDELKNDQIQQEEDKKVLIIYASGFFGVDYENSDGNERFYVTKNSLQEKMKKISYFCDINFTYQHATEGFLVTPISEYRKRIYYKVIQMENLKINSTFFDNSCIENLLELIETNYEQFDSFIVIHGTDSLTYISSIVSFMLENLQKPVIFTGSMVPLSIMRNDSFNNLLGALTIAGHFHIPEVSVFFNNRLLRANRTTKIDAQGMDCFMSPNFTSLAEFKVHIEVNWPAILRTDEVDDLKVVKKIEDCNIEVVKFTPCFTEVSLVNLVRTPGIRGIIIETYGPGNLPLIDEKFALVCKEATSLGIAIVAISQSLKTYNSHQNQKACNNEGIAYGGDMTTEATLAKLIYLFTKGFNSSEVIEMMSHNLRGELTLQTNDQKFENQQENLVEAITERFSNRPNSKQSQIDLIKGYIVPNVACYMAQYGFMHYLQEMKVQDINFKFADYDRRTALHVAVMEQKEEVCEFLINEKVDVNMVDYFGRSPLYEAILTKNKKISYLLVKNGAQVIGDSNEITDLLLESAQKGDLDTLKLLYHSGMKNFNDYVNIDNRNIGHIAAAEGQEEIIKFLKYTARFDFSQRDIWDRIPLDDAIEFSQSSIIFQLSKIIN